ncbi:MAG: carboxypeptidase Taq [Granulosicoccus sp.]|jgi:carboxypeptidase Taq
MSQSLKNLEKQFHRIAQLDHASTFLSWDQFVMMPNAGMTPRSEALAEIAIMRHELLTSVAMGDWLDEASEQLSSGAIDSTHSSHIREMRRTWQQSMAMPADLVHAKVIAGSRCEHGWRTQKGDSDWKGFLKNFIEVVALSREEAQARQAQAQDRFATPYDSLLDLHCSGDSQALINGVFAELKLALPALLQEVLAHQSAQTTKDLRGHYPIENQQKLSEDLMSMFGFDFNAGRLDVSMHPFSTGGLGDQRITTRYREMDFADALQATAHETGHASYEAGLPVSKTSYPVGSSRNMCIHESQSLMFEKQIFLSKAFGQALIKPLHKHLPTTAAFNAADIWMAQTRVKPSFIRVEADEVTYPLHVMLRYDIESALINGDIEADVIPEAWESSLNDYLSLSTNGNHSIGCLQDIHWTDGAFGYFPSYTMGAVNAAQLSAAMKRDCPEWKAQFAAGELEFARTWLSENIWQHGCDLESQELMQRATGEGSTAKHLLAHLKSRYLDDAD